MRYGYGKRAYCYGNAAAEQMHLIKGKHCASLARKLGRYYKKAGGDPTILPVLQVFLECSLEYLKGNASSKEFCFSSLEKLARTVQREYQSSKFEYMMYGKDISAFKQFQEMYTAHTQRDLVMALQQTMNFMEQYHGRVDVRFAVKKRN